MDRRLSREYVEMSEGDFAFFVPPHMPHVEANMKVRPMSFGGWSAARRKTS